jgi:hypothetical protein
MDYESSIDPQKKALLQPYVDTIHHMAEAELRDDAVGLEGLVCLAESLSTITAIKKEGEVLRTLTDLKLDLLLKIHLYFDAQIKSQKIEDEYKTYELQDKEFDLKDRISKIFDRHIFKICVYTWRYGPLMGVVVDNEKSLSFDPQTEPETVLKIVRYTLLSEGLDILGNATD